MTPIENIKKACKEMKNISITTLEQELGYSNGSLAKAKDIPSSRIYEISKYLGVSMEYLMIGKESEKVQYSTEMAMLVRKIRNDKEMSQALIKYFGLSDEKKKHVVNMINMLSEV